MFDDIHQQVIALNTQMVEAYGDGRYRDALAFSLQARDLARHHFAPDDPERATSLSNLADVYEALGDYNQAEPLYQEALTILRGRPEERLSLGGVLNNFAHLYVSMGKYADAEPFYREALAIWRNEEGEISQMVAVCLNHLGLLYQALNNYATAESFLQQALSIRRQLGGEEHFLVARSLNNLGVLYRDQGRFAEAEPLLQQALRIQRQILGPQHPEVASILNNLASVLRGRRRFTEAIALYQEAITASRASLGDIHPLLASYINNLAVLYKITGDYDAAEPLYQQALAMRITLLGKEHPDVAGTLYNLALLHAARGRADEALAFMQQATDLDDQLTGQLFAIGSEKQRMAYLAQLKTGIDGFLSLVLGQLAHSQPAVQAAMDLVLRRKAIGIEALATQRDAVLGGRYPALAPRLDALNRVRTQMVQKTLAGPTGQSVQAHQKELQELAEQRDQLETELAHAIPEMSLTQQLRNARRETVVQKLPPQSSLIEFLSFEPFDFRAIPAHGEQVWQEPHYAAFLLFADHPEQVNMLDLGEARSIDEHISTFRTALLDDHYPPAVRHIELTRSENHITDLRQTGTELRTYLFDPLLPALGTCKKLFLAPDGNIALLPFETLPLENGRHLIDDYHITYLGSGRDLLRLNLPIHGSVSPPLVIADPDFDLTGTTSASSPPLPPAQEQDRLMDLRSLSFDRLPGTHLEGQKIASLLAVQPLIGEHALETSLKACHSPRILHIATHGFFLAQQSSNSPDEGVAESEGKLERFFKQQITNPLLRSGLALAGVNTWSKGGNLPVEAEDGLLTAEDVVGLDLLDTELVVLSACETGLGDIQVGEGVFGLRRAFIVAGARTLVTSLWKVPDRQTQELMIHFYQHILAGQPRGTALRQAQLTIKKTNGSSRAWGAFICQGDPGPLLLIRGDQGLPGR